MLTGMPVNALPYRTRTDAEYPVARDLERRRPAHGLYGRHARGAHDYFCYAQLYRPHYGLFQTSTAPAVSPSQAELNWA